MVPVGTPNGVVNSELHQKNLPITSKRPKALEVHQRPPWLLSPGDVQNEPGEVPTMVASEPVVPEDELPPRLPNEREAEGVPKRVYIRRNVEHQKHGFT